MRRKWSIVILLILMAIGAMAETMGITEPGTNNYSDWYGRVIDSVPLEYDASILEVTMSAHRNKILVSFICPTMPVFKEIDLSTYSISDSTVMHFNAGRLIQTISRPERGTNFHICEKNDSTIVYDCDNYSQNVISSFRLNLRSSETHRVFLPEEHLIYINDDNGLILRKRNLATGCEEELDLSLYENDYTDFVVDDHHDIVYLLVSGEPSAVYKVDLDSMSVTSAMYLPSPYKCRLGRLSADALDMYLIAKHDNSLLYSLIKLQLYPLGVVDIEELNPGEGPVRLFDIYDSQVYIIDGSYSPAVIIYDQEMNRINRIELSDLTPPVMRSLIYNNKLMLLDCDNPVNGQVYSLETLVKEAEFSFPGEVYSVNSIAISDSNNLGWITTNRRDPASVLKMPIDANQSYETYDYDLGPNTEFSLIEIVDSLNMAIVATSGNLRAIVTIDLTSNEIVNTVPISGNKTISDLAIDDQNFHVFVLTDDEVSKFDIQTGQLLDSLVLPPPYNGLYYCALDNFMDILLIGNTQGRVLKCSTTPLNMIDDLQLLQEDETVTAGAIIGEVGRSIICTERTGAASAGIYSIDLQNFAIDASSELGFAEYSVSDIEYCDQKSVLKLGIHRGNSKIVYYNPVTLVRVGESQDEITPGYFTDGALHLGSRRNFWLNRLITSQITAETSTRAYSIFASLYSLSAPARIVSVNLYSRVADGSVRLGIYNSSMECIWQSESIVNLVTEGWITCDINQGFPGELAIYPGEYWLAFQTTSLEDVPSVQSGEMGHGLRQAMNYGEFPDKLFFTEETTDRWVINAEWEYLYPTSTPTVTPTMIPTATPSPSFTPTITPTPTPSPTDSPSPEPTPTATPTENPGVTLKLSQSVFYRGDRLLLDAEIVPDFSVSQAIVLWVALEVYGEFWFGPRWIQSGDTYPLGILEDHHSERILDFVWPETHGSGDDLKFWGAITDQSLLNIIGAYDVVVFGYQS